MKQILFATGNQAKVNRFSKGLNDRGIRILTLEDVNLDVDIEECGKDAIENALIKARAYHIKTSMPTIAVDDNLYIENLPDNKQPGMYVRRVNGKRLSDTEMLEYYSKLVRDYGTDGKLTAKWVYGMAFLINGKEYTYTWNKSEFYLVDKSSNIINPGYPLNSISINKKLNKYFSELTEEDKLLIQEDENHVIEFIYSNLIKNM